MSSPSSCLLLSLVSAGLVAVLFIPHHSVLDIVRTPDVVPKPLTSVSSPTNLEGAHVAARAENVAQVADVPQPTFEAVSPSVYKNLETEVEPFGESLSTAASALFPLVAAIAALFTGLFMRRTTEKYNNVLAPVEMSADEDTPLTRRGILAALAAAPLAAAAPAFAKSGGRVGGSAFAARKAARPPPTASTPPPASGPTNVYVSPPPVYGAPGYGGYGMAPVTPYGFGFSRGELLALGAVELGQAFIREQQRQAFLKQQLETQRQLGRDEAAIQALQQQLADQEARMRDMSKVMMERNVAVPAS